MERKGQNKEENKIRRSKKKRACDKETEMERVRQWE